MLCDGCISLAEGRAIETVLNKAIILLWKHYFLSVVTSFLTPEETDSTYKNILFNVSSG
jgi:hypothetical protein